MKKKIIAMSMVLVLVLVAIGGATLAYFTDTDSAKNVMVVGNIKIEQTEWEGVYDDAGKLVGLKEFTQGKNLVPSAIPFAAYQEESMRPQWKGLLDAAGYDCPENGGNDMFANNMNAIDKIVFVKNTSTYNDLYYRTIIAIEQPVNAADTDGLTRVNCNNNVRFDWDAATDGAQNADNSLLYQDVEINGRLYDIMVATYVPTLAPNEVSRPSLLQIAFDSEVTNEQAAAYGATVEVLTLSQAVQAKGFDDAHTALNAAFGDLTAANFTTWLAELELEQVVYVPVI